MPHANWRGHYDRGTNGAGAEASQAIVWPGKRLRAYLASDADDVPGLWIGSLARGMADQSGLLYRRNRYYDPATGQFTREDPIGLAGGLNLYGYAAGDPVNFSDPFGLCPEESRDTKGRCPGGLSIAQWEAVEKASKYLRPGAQTQLLELLNDGQIRPGELKSNVGMSTAYLRNPTRITINTRLEVRKGVHVDVLSLYPADVAWLFGHELGHHAQTGGTRFGVLRHRIRVGRGFPAEADADAFACANVVTYGSIANNRCR